MIGRQEVRAGRRLLTGGILLAASFTAPSTSALAAAPGGAVPPTFSVTGSGFGHGIGMTQYGALGQARAGRSAETIVDYYYSGASATALTDALPLRVNLAHGVSTVALRGEALDAGGGAITLTPTAGAAAGGGVTVPAGTPVTMRVASTSAGQMVSVTGAGVTPPAPSAPSSNPKPSPSADPATTGITAPKITITWPGTRELAGPASLLNVAAGGESLTDSRRHRYRWGSVEVSAVGGHLEVVNTVNLHDEYLKGIGEMPSSWPAQALAAQVIASRSYALNAYNAGTKASCGGCHLYDSTVSQVFLGWSKESEPTYGASWVAAVAATAPSSSTGTAVTLNGRVLPAYFSSSSGGRTENNDEVWGGAPASYLRSVADPWSADTSVNPAYASWTRTSSQAAVASAFGLPDVASVALGARTAGGSVKNATATSSSGTTKTITGATLRTRLGLPSTWVAGIAAPAGWVSSAPVPSTPGSVPRPPVNAVYTSPSPAHTVNGRQWRARCEPYAGATAQRCFTDIVATTVARKGSAYVTTNGWVFNNLTYTDLDSSAWVGNVLATQGEHTSGGRQWKTECNTDSPSWRSCTSYIWATVISRQAGPKGYTFTTYPTWQFNNMVWLYRGA